MRVLFNLQLGEELITLLELRRIVSWKAILGNFVRSLGLICGILLEMTIAIVAISIDESACDREHAWPIVYSDHQIVDLLELSNAWKGQLACLTIALSATANISEIILALFASIAAIQIIIIHENVLLGWLCGLNNTSIVKLDTDFVGIDVYMLCRSLCLLLKWWLIIIVWQLLFMFIIIYLPSKRILKPYRVYIHFMEIFIDNLVWLDTRAPRCIQRAVLSKL